jgi:hypothetical protein
LANGAVGMLMPFGDGGGGGQRVQFTGRVANRVQVDEGVGTRDKSQVQTRRERRIPSLNN